MNRELKRSLLFFVGPIVSAAIGFITTPIITYFIAPEEYANVNVYQMVQSIIGVIVYLGFDQAYVRYFNKEENKPKLWVNAVAIPLILGLIVSLVIWIYRPFFANYTLGDKEQFIPILLLCIAIPLMILERFILLWYRMRERALFYSIANIMLKAVVLSLTVLFLLLYERSYYSAIYGSVVGQGIYDLFLIIISISQEKHLTVRDISITEIKKLAKYGLPLAPVDAISMLLNSADRIAIKQFSSATELGLYGVALRITGIVAILKACITSFWAPLSFRWKAENRENSAYERVINLVSFAMIAVCLLSYTIKPFIFWIFGNGYNDAQYIFPFLMFYPVFYTIGEILIAGIMFNNKGKYITYFSALSLGIDLILNFFLVPDFGAKGAALATALANLCYFWGILFYSRKLWFRFSCYKLVISIFVLVVAAIVNTYVEISIPVMIVNVISLCTISIMYLDTIKYGLKLVFLGNRGK